MGCHVWYARPMTDEEVELMKKYAPIDAEEYFNDGHISTATLNNILKSIETGENCIDGYNWLDYGFGYGLLQVENPDKFGIMIRDKDNRLYTTVEDFHDLCRESFGVYNYPRKIIHNKKELRRYLGKRYFKITSDEHRQLDEFWSKYPGGVIQWG